MPVIIETVNGNYQKNRLPAEVVGPTGPAGPEGSVGPAGVTGIQGITGLRDYKEVRVKLA